MSFALIIRYVCKGCTVFLFEVIMPVMNTDITDKPEVFCALQVTILNSMGVTGKVRDKVCGYLVHL